VLRQQELPYTVFICTDVLTGGPVPWFMRVYHLATAVGLEPLREEWGLKGHNLKTNVEMAIALKETPLERILSGLARLEESHEIPPPTPERLFLSAQEVRQLADDEVSFGSHTRRHPILSKLSASEQRQEIEISRREIEQLVGTPPSQFAYPNGTRLDFDSGTQSILKTGGYTHGYTTIQRHLSKSDEPFALPRIGMDAHSSHLRRTLKQITPELASSSRTEKRIRELVKKARQ
jgi:transcriptional regulator CtsR